MSEVIEAQTETQKPFGNSGEHITRAGDDLPPDLMPDVITATFCDYLKTLKLNSSTINHCAVALKMFFAFLRKKGIADLRAVRRLNLVEYQAKLMRQPWTPGNVHKHISFISRFYAFLENQGNILMNPAIDLEMPKLVRNIPRSVLTRTEMKKILDMPDTSRPIGIRDKTMMEVLYSTGIRIGELCHLTVHDVDLLNGYLRVNSGKGCKDRVLPLGKKARKYLSEYLRHVRGRLAAERRDERTLFVTAYRTKAALSDFGIRTIIKCYAKQAGIRKRVSPHVFRHTCATHMLEGGADISHVQRLLGHVLINTTQIYTRVAQPDVKKTHHKTHPRERDKA